VKLLFVVFLLLAGHMLGYFPSLQIGLLTYFGPYHRSLSSASSKEFVCRSTWRILKALSLFQFPEKDAQTQLKLGLANVGQISSDQGQYHVQQSRLAEAIA
jgi:hypothetical protein